MAGRGLHLEEERLVADDVLVVQRLNVHEVLLEEEDVLAVQRYRLHCVALVGRFGEAVADHPVRPLADLVAERVLVLEEGVELVGGVRVLVGVDLGERHLLVGEDGARLPAPVLLQFLLQLQRGLVDHRHRRQRTADAGEPLLALRDLRGHIHLRNKMLIIAPHSTSNRMGYR